MPDYRNFDKPSPMYAVVGDKTGEGVKFMIDCNPIDARDRWKPLIAKLAQGSLVPDPKNELIQTLAFKVTPGNTRSSAPGNVITGLVSQHTITQKDKGKILEAFETPGRAKARA